MKKIVLLDGKTLGGLDYNKLREFGEVIYYDTTKNDEVIDRIRDANIILTNKVVLNRENLKYAKNLEIICETATGYNNIDIDYAKKHKIAVTNVAGYSTDSVVQHTFATLLSLVNKISYYNSFINSGQYYESGLFTNLQNEFYELKGKTFGIIGLGEIGRGVAKIAKAFGMNVIYYSTTGKNNNSDYNRVELDELFKLSDFISIHAPLSSSTEGLINYNNLCKMKKTAILINMGRGPIVVEEDIAKAINNNIIYGAILDVFEKEPLNINSPLLKIKEKDRIILTPHVGWASVEARQRLFNNVIDNIKAFYSGEIRNRVDI